MTLVALWLHGVYLDSLPAPERFGTTAERAWRVDLLAAPMWVRGAAVVPALLVTVLLFLDQNITARIVNSPGIGCTKAKRIIGPGGRRRVGGWLLPVRSALAGGGNRTLHQSRAQSGHRRRGRQCAWRHARASDSRAREPDHAARDSCFDRTVVVLAAVVQVIPMAVLYGLFLFMGVVSIKGNQFFERLSLWFMDSDLYPSTHYTRRVPMKVVHQFTLLQLAGLVVLWTVKVSSLAILFPLFIAAGVPIRFLAGRLFTPEHLAALDAEEEPDEEETHYAA